MADATMAKIKTAKMDDILATFSETVNQTDTSRIIELPFYMPVYVSRNWIDFRFIY